MLSRIFLPTLAGHRLRLLNRSHRRPTFAPLRIFFCTPPGHFSRAFDPPIEPLNPSATSEKLNISSSDDIIALFSITDLFVADDNFYRFSLRVPPPSRSSSSQPPIPPDIPRKTDGVGDSFCCRNSSDDGPPLMPFPLFVRAEDTMQFAELVRKMASRSVPSVEE
jgi:hypothetical protein